MRWAGDSMGTSRPSGARAAGHVGLRVKVTNALPAIGLFLTGLVAWELAVRLLDIKQFILPRPTGILHSFLQQLPQLLGVGLYTATEAIGGLAIGCSAGFLAALAAAHWSGAREALLPFATAANSVPIIAFAPIMNNWFGVTTQLSKMMVVAIITFFPMLINMIRGLTQVEPASLELMRSYAAHQGQVLLKVRLPHALPYLFNALKLCSTLSLIGAVVSEFFGGPRHALGVYITQEAAFFRFEQAWAGILIAAFLGITFYLAILLVERWAIPWHTSLRGSED